MKDNASIFSTSLKDRDLWIDGTSSLNAEGLARDILAGVPIDDLLNSTISEDCAEDVKNLIRWSGIENRILNVKTKNSVRLAEPRFEIPEKYLKTDGIEDYILKGFMFRHNARDMSLGEKKLRLERIEAELQLFRSMGLLDVLSCAVYIICTFIENNIVWGPGRGSACCSYILYLLRVHDVDSVHYGLPIDEFLRDT